MEFTIYDYESTSVQVAIPDEEIISIVVRVISGDEVVDVVTKNQNYHFDSSGCRCTNYDDGFYIVSGDNIEKWLNWEPVDKERTYPYARLEDFWNID